MIAPSTGGNWFTRGGWRFVVHVLTFGFLAPVPFVHAAVRTRRAGHIALTVASFVLIAVSFAVFASADKDAAGKSAGPAANAGGTALLVAFLAGLVALIVIRPQVFPPATRTDDDGGLVDLDSAPVGVIGQVIGLPPAQAASIVRARQAAGRFGGVDDVFAYAELPVDVWDRVRDRAVVVG